MLRLPLLVAAVWALFAQPGTTDEPLLQPLSDGVQVELVLQPEPYFAFRGLQLRDVKRAADLIAISVADSPLENPPQLIGKFELTAEQIEFHPRFPLQRATSYRLQLARELFDQPPAGRELRFSVPAAPMSVQPQVKAVYPSGDTLPENLLKFYIHFSQPMSRGDAYQRIHLLAGDEPVDEPFLELGEELWDAEQTRFTLFIHPGRIKRGVQPRELRGAPLATGKSYTLRIDRDWPSAEGLPMSAPYEKKFEVTTAVHGQLNPEKWQIQTPAVDSRQPVALSFDAPLDHGMLHRVLTVHYNDGSLITGEISTDANESRWLFTPTENWKIGAHHIEVATNLEDICGNSIARPFEVDLQAASSPVPAAKIAIEFIVK